MSTLPRCLLLASALALSATACGDDDEPASTTTTTTSTTTSSTATSSTTSTTAAADGVVIVIRVEGGTVVGGSQRFDVPLGDAVTLRVTSDVADEVHVHGYDRKVDLVPGVEASLTFEAEIPGVFEIELEERGLQIAQLEVS